MMTQSNLYKEYASVEDSREGLKKYCYFDFTDESEHCRYLTLMLLSQCDNDEVLQFFWFFFNKAIKVYYYVDRPKFNRIRACFMRFILATLLLDKIDVSIAKDVFSYYLNWFTSCGLAQSLNCVKVAHSSDFLVKLVYPAI